MFSKSEPLGNTLIVFGCIALAIGLFSGISKSILEVWNDIGNYDPKGIIEPAPPPEWLQAIESLISTVIESAINLLIAFRESPVWLVLIFTGVSLILMGLWVKPPVTQENQ